jgi:hypothetical protein
VPNVDIEQTFDGIKANLFPASHAAIGDWKAFRWHRYKGIIQTSKPNSSQALAIDVFGTIKVSPEKDRILGALAQKCGIPGDGPWALKLEWNDPDNFLREPAPTQVDALAIGSLSFLVIECKFAETGGACSQTRRDKTIGLPQCSGDYVMQENPRNPKTTGRCALTKKGIRYWETIPRLFDLDADQDYQPCPFKGPAFQWMRNVVLADRLANYGGLSGAVIAAFADGETFHTAKEVRAGTIGYPARVGERLITPLSYQSIVALAQSLSDKPNEWNELAIWIERKIGTEARRLMDKKPSN